MLYETKRIVIIRPGALGDTLLTFPALVWLRRLMPDARLTLIARRDTLPLALASGLADAAWPYDLPDWSALFADPTKADEAATLPGTTSARPASSTSPSTLARTTLAGADLVGAWLADPANHVARNLRAFGVERIVVAPGRPTTPEGTGALASPTRHAALFLLDGLTSLANPLAVSGAVPESLVAYDFSGTRGDIGRGAATAEDGGATPASAAEPNADWRQSRLLSLLPTLTAPPEDARAMEAMWRALGLPTMAPSTEASSSVASRRVIALHAGSGGAAKRWPPAFFAALAEAITQVGDIPLLIEGPQDEVVVAGVMSAWRAANLAWAPLPVAQGLSVGALAALIAHCAAYVGNDSGVAHLAGMLGTPTVALFGPTDPAVWAPLGRAVWTLRAPAGDLSRLAPEQVTATLRLALATLQ